MCVGAVGCLSVNLSHLALVNGSHIIFGAPSSTTSFDTVFANAMIVQPTFFFGPPAVFQALFAHYQSQLSVSSDVA
jgi:long-subunit acyl-CoA synthetase (AMP-forming)